MTNDEDKLAKLITEWLTGVIPKVVERNRSSHTMNEHLSSAGSTGIRLLKCFSELGARPDFRRILI